MKKQFFGAILATALLASNAAAVTCKSQLMGTGVPGLQATEFCSQLLTPTTLTAASGLTVTSGGLTVTAGGATVTSGDLTLTDGVVIQTEVLSVPAWQGARGATATVGWIVTGADKGLATLAQSATADTLVIPIVGLNIGDTIVSYKVTGQVDSAGNGATVDADLRKLTTAAAGTADASIGAITQVSVTADAAIASSKTLATPEVVASGENFYLLVTATTAATTDVEIAGVELTITKGN